MRRLSGPTNRVPIYPDFPAVLGIAIYSIILHPHMFLFVNHSTFRDTFIYTPTYRLRFAISDFRPFKCKFAPFFFMDSNNIIIPLLLIGPKSQTTGRNSPHAVISPTLQFGVIKFPFQIITVSGLRSGNSDFPRTGSLAHNAGRSNRSQLRSGYDFHLYFSVHIRDTLSDTCFDIIPACRIITGEAQRIICTVQSLDFRIAPI